MKRAKHSLSHYKLLTCDMGKLVPVGVYEVLPGDTVQQHTAALIRVSPLVAPVMHPVTVRIHHWFVPNRIIWDRWEDFITGGSDGQGDGAVPPVGTHTPVKGDILDYMGVPVGAAVNLSDLPIRAYNLIYNEFYRDQDLVNEVSLQSVAVQNVAWEKDYFTASRPWPQKGPDVTLPLGTTAPVFGSGFPLWDYPGVTGGHLTADGSAAVKVTGSPSGTGDLVWGSTTGLTADLSNAEAANINDLRRAFAIQRYQEARAAYGSRYTEYLRYLGVRSSDARLQRPEYLGGGKQTIAFSEVLRTGNDAASTDPIGEMKGHGIAAMRSRRYRRFFEEHGIVLSLMSVRPKTIYANGINKLWSRQTKEDYWQKELELIGQQEVYNREVYADGTAADVEVFGYNDRYSEYRHIPSGVAGDFRDTLDYWHMARIFAARPALNGSFVNCDATKRIFAEQTTNALWCMVNHSVQARRMVGKKVIGRII